MLHTDAAHSSGGRQVRRSRPALFRPASVATSLAQDDTVSTTRLSLRRLALRMTQCPRRGSSVSYRSKVHSTFALCDTSWKDFLSARNSVRRSGNRLSAPVFIIVEVASSQLCCRPVRAKYDLPAGSSVPQAANWIGRERNAGHSGVLPSCSEQDSDLQTTYAFVFTSPSTPPRRINERLESSSIQPYPSHGR